MKVGTKSVLFGAHAFWLHPWFVAYGWYKLYGFPWDLRLWVAFFVHDLGYWGTPNMDGAEGEQHPRLGAKIMGWLFDELCGITPYRQKTWYQFSFYHSRYLAKIYATDPSRLCFADKMAFVVTPRWLYVPMTMLTGEVYEYMRAHSQEVGQHNNPWRWHPFAVDYTRKWVYYHKDGTIDIWTKGHKR